MIPSASGSYPRRDGNRVRPLIGGREAFGRIAEAVDAARRRVWVTVAFYADDFRVPDGRGLFELLESAAARGVDVRAVFWQPNPESAHYGRTYPTDAPARPRLRIRRDRAIGPYCHHQKSWMVDDTGFVGGINLTAKALERHDAYLEVNGPSASDVAHNFVQRWNGASEPHASDDLPLPTTVLAPCGASTVQIQRMFRDDRSILGQYERAIDAARRSIYIENQAIPIPAIASRLEGALERGVEVVLLVPAVPEEHVYAARKDPARRPLFEGLEALGRYPRFRLAGLPVYVHCKLMIVDDVWATIGSCNLHAYSLGGHSEMNAAIWDETVVRDLRDRLRRQHEGDIFTLLPERYASR
ncbi:MAG: phosphatidylserine/phosphatidylglycerophosphate/cardiolipin synthase family protein [Reyranella sp.]|uniref:phospholipase D-like domain-containing protein n=1 Tax=Reyranella sp. TaxID=1929291 RepID=UPI001AC22B6A|nr:phosphatidylserine/phosphatidylglycerophosphate/cardiolipin synthase family protein [Reyranella sp.]MBN9089996.1 phosphatidylserine/phosphatidylglycerophosphate/cardiolipin synthase family protein [Reyranella sp.]